MVRLTRGICPEKIFRAVLLAFPILLSCHEMTFHNFCTIIRADCNCLTATSEIMQQADQNANQFAEQPCPSKTIELTVSCVYYIEYLISIIITIKNFLGSVLTLFS